MRSKVLTSVGQKQRIVAAALPVRGTAVRSMVCAGDGVIRAARLA